MTQLTHAEQTAIVDNAVATLEPSAAVPVSAEQQMITSIAQMATNPDVDVEKIQALLNIQLTMMDRQSKMDFDQALSRVQADMPRITERGQIKNKSGQVTSRYLKYEDIDLAIRPRLQKEGFSLVHDCKEQGQKMVVKTILKHCNGHEESTEFPLPYDAPNALKNAVQAAVSTFSYGKRVNVCKLLNIVAQGEDDDAQLAAANYIDSEQARGIQGRIDAIYEQGITFDTTKFLKYIGAPSVEEIPVSKYDMVLTMLDRKEKEGGES